MVSEMKVEGYWTQKMVEWRQRPISLRIRNLKTRKAVYVLRGLFLKTSICLQNLIVLTSKLLLLVSFCLASPFMWCFRRRNRVSQSDPELDFGSYVMLLEGEPELAIETRENICREVDELIHKGKMKRPENLLKLLLKSCSFKGVAEFDSDQVPSLYSQDPPYCWSLPVVTLACIALALPGIEKSQHDHLLRSVTEGLPFLNLVDKTLHKKGNIRSAAEMVWVKLEQDANLHEKCKNRVEILQEVCDKAEKTVVEFLRGFKSSCLMRNPVNWPANVIAANSMYRVGKTILLRLSNGGGESDEELFEMLWIMIGEIVGACLTNLGQVISLKVHRKGIEKRERGVRKAALVLGETQEIIALLQKRQLPITKLATIEEWRAVVKQGGVEEDEAICNV